MFIDIWGLIPTTMDTALMVQNVNNVSKKYLDDTPYDKRYVIGNGWRVDSVLDWHEDGNGRVVVYSRQITYKDSVGFEYLIAFRGTNGLNDVLDDFLGAFGTSPDAWISLIVTEAFVSTVGNDKVTMAGHSKGGGEAILCALANETYCITFNTFIPPVENYGLMLKALSYSKLMTHYVVKGEYLTLFNALLSPDKMTIGAFSKWNNKLVMLETVHKAPAWTLFISRTLYIVLAANASAKNHGMDAVITALKRDKYK
jgi:hypothetical protein